MANIYNTGRSQAFSWFLHRITGTFLIFLLITHFWVQHFDANTKVITEDVITSNSEKPNPTYAVEGVKPGPDGQVTPYEVVMARLAHPVYSVLWKGFNILFLIFALHHGIYGLNNVLGDYIRNDKWRVAVYTLTWTLALVLLIIGLYSVVMAGAGYEAAAAVSPSH